MLPELPSKIPEFVSRDHSEKAPARRGTLRSTARVLERTLDAVKGHRLRGRQRGHDEWVMI